MATYVIHGTHGHPDKVEADRFATVGEFVDFFKREGGEEVVVLRVAAGRIVTIQRTAS
ncbi:hypothetical protein ACIBQ6_22100 [Nonomuraea sp. NPDC049655]|uniref:hypothetical protein n=1 Tax=Nonomuraea sp. NPDC049655 TaxID=3364355 RepID=UPI00378DB44E